MGRTAVILGTAALSFVLLCCAGTAVVGAVFGEPEPARTDTAADERQEPVVADRAPTMATGDPGANTVSASPSTPATSAAPSPVVQVRTVTETARIRFGERTVKDPSLAEGKRVVRTRGVDGVRTLTYQVTITDGAQTGKKLLRSVVTKQPVTQVVAVGTRQEPQCHPNYGGCVPIASDVDCAGGSGDGPAYVTGPIRVTGDDVYDLDRDKDGYACDD